MQPLYSSQLLLPAVASTALEHHPVGNPCHSVSCGCGCAFQLGTLCIMLAPHCALRPEVRPRSQALSELKADTLHCCMLQAEQENAVQQGLKAVENGLEVCPSLS